MIVIVFYATVRWMLYCWSQGLPLWQQPRQPPPERLLPPPRRQPTTSPSTLPHPMERTVRHPGVPRPIVRSPSNIELAPMPQQGQIGVAVRVGTQCHQSYPQGHHLLRYIRGALTCLSPSSSATHVLLPILRLPLRMQPLYPRQMRHLPLTSRPMWYNKRQPPARWLQPSMNVLRHREEITGQLIR